MAMRFTLAAAVAAAVFSTAIDASQGKSQGRGRGNGGNTAGADISVSAVFTFRDSDRVTFRDYFVAHKITAQPLPPGIAKNVARGKPLPPGIAKKALPNDLILGLGPRIQPGVTFAILGDRVVAMKSGLIIDVMINVFK